MTRPIFEPSLQRTDARLGYGQAQLFRRPAPSGGFTPVIFRARRTSSFQSLGAGGAETDLTWNTWENGDTTVFDDNLSGSDLRSVTLLEEGVYSLMCIIAVQALASGQLVIVMNDGYDNPTIQVHPAQVAGSGGDYLYSDMRTYPPFQPVDNPPGVAQVSFDAAQNSGVSRNTQYGIMMEIVYFGPFVNQFTS